MIAIILKTESTGIAFVHGARTGDGVAMLRTWPTLEEAQDFALHEMAAQISDIIYLDLENLTNQQRQKTTPLNFILTA